MQGLASRRTGGGDIGAPAEEPLPGIKGEFPEHVAFGSIISHLTRLPGDHPRDLLNRAAPQALVPVITGDETPLDQSVPLVHLSFRGIVRGDFADLEPDSILG